jgi:hypothetical protein
VSKRSIAALAAILVSGGIWGGTANAMFAAPAAMSGAADNSIVTAAACGHYGCARTHLPAYPPYSCGYYGCVRLYPWAFPCQYYSLYCPYPYWPNGWYRY